MITNDLFEKILLQPHAKLNAKKVLIVSGYASPAMVYRHLKQTDENIEISLILGMASKDAISKQQHHAFKQMVNQDFAGRFTCYYANLSYPVHSKTYVWLDTNDTPVVGFLGSANYSQNAFSNRQYEAMSTSDPMQIYHYFLEILRDSISCMDPNIETYFSFSDLTNFAKTIKPLNDEIIATVQKDDIMEKMTEGREYVKLSLLASTGSSKGEVPEHSGLNWGQREGREPNQAYIAIPIDIQRSHFFPDIKTPFIIYTDDGKCLDCVRAQGDYGKALHTYRNNSILGLYFRERLNIPSGAHVNLSNLSNYGRTDVIIYKIDDETYYMDFSS